jgi:hypothetical protein
VKIKTAILTIIILGFIGEKLYSQDYPSKQNDFKSEISDFIFSKKDFKNYDFILLKYEECYWFDETEYRLVCFSYDGVDLIKITKKKKNNRIRIGRKHPANSDSYNELLDSLLHIGLFDLKESNLQIDLINEIDNTRKRLNISDGIVETFEIYNDKNTWGLSVYEAIRYFEFCGNENLLTFSDACRLFDKKWMKKN